jgi:UDP-glucose 4-epimerase
MRILITGGAGFIGSYLEAELLKAGHTLIIVDNFSTGIKSNISTEVLFYEADILDFPRMNDIIFREKPEIVFHLAAQTSVAYSIEYPQIDANTNVLGSISIIESCARNGVQKIIYFSTAAVYGKPEALPLVEEHPVRPLSAYGISKHTVEHYLEMYSRQKHIKYCILRCSNVYGKRQNNAGEGGVITRFMQALLNNQVLYIHGDGEQTRDFIYVQDVVNAALKAIELEDNCIINISTGEPTSVNNLLSLLQKVSGRSTVVKNVEERAGDIKHSVMDNKKARYILNWNLQYTLEQGIKSLIED